MHGGNRAVPTTLAGYFDALTRAVFQPGLNWRVIEAKWPDIGRALAGFDPEKIADLAPPDIDTLMGDPRVIRNRRKLEATVENARAMLTLDREHGGFVNYLRSHGSFEPMAADLRRRFRFLGESGVYYFLWSVGEEVPPREEVTKER